MLLLTTKASKVSTGKDCVKQAVETNSFGRYSVYSKDSEDLEKYQGKIYQLAL